MPSTLSKPSFISFNELIPGSQGVRYTDIHGVAYMSVRDIIMAICSKDGHDSMQIWRRLPEQHKNEFQDYFVENFQFPGRGQSEQPVITLQGALKLIMWLPGNIAKDFRSKACDILTRYLAGDASLHSEVAHNASIGLIAASRELVSEVLASGKRKREDDSDVAYVYATVSDAFPGLVKIGRTEDLDTRLGCMNTSCAPKPHRYVAIAPTYHAVRDERVIHSFFMDEREEGEFFRTSVENVKRALARLVTSEFNEEMQSRLILN